MQTGVWLAGCAWVLVALADPSREQEACQTVPIVVPRADGLGRVFAGTRPCLSAANDPFSSPPGVVAEWLKAPVC
jgi:hypothetical protein